MRLQDFDIEVHHIKGCDNTFADFFSRNADDNESSVAEEPLTEAGFLVEEAKPDYEPLLAQIYLFLRNPQRIHPRGTKSSPSKYQKYVHKYTIVHEKLYMRCQSRNRDLTDTGILLVPRISERLGILAQLHESCGHFGRDSTFYAARTMYYWPKMYDDIREHISTCHPCQLFRKPSSHPSPDNRWTIFPMKIFETFSLDFVGPLPRSAHGNEYILVVVEHYTRFPLAYAVPSANAATVARILYNTIVCFFGPPSRIITDNGTHFNNEIIHNLCETVKTTFSPTTPYNPQCNGLTERFNGTLIKQLKISSASNPENWDLFLNDILYAYRTRKLSGHPYSPYEILFGSRPPTFDPVLRFAANFMPEEQRRVQLEAIREQMFDGRAQAIDQYNPITSFEVGQLVLLARSLSRANKLTSLYYPQPYSIKSAHDGNTYKIQTLRGHEHRTKVNGRRLKLYLARPPPTASTSGNQDLLLLDNPALDL